MPGVLALVGALFIGVVIERSALKQFTRVTSKWR